MIINAYSAQSDWFSVHLRPVPEFLSKCNPNQRYWLLYRSLLDFSQHLEHLHSQFFISGSDRKIISSNLHDSPADLSSGNLTIEKQEIMQSWELPLMKKMADRVTQRGGDILEVGFGIGLSASAILARDISSYTVIESNRDIVDKFKNWRLNYPDKDIRMIHGRWQDVVGEIGEYDGVLFDTYPESELDWYENSLNKSCYAENFFPYVRALLKKSGVFTYYTGEIDSLGRNHQLKLFEIFEKIELEVCKGLEPSEDCTYWWSDRMMVVTAHNI